VSDHEPTHELENRNPYQKMNSCTKACRDTRTAVIACAPGWLKPYLSKVEMMYGVYVQGTRKTASNHEATARRRECISLPPGLCKKICRAARLLLNPPADRKRSPASPRAYLRVGQLFDPLECHHGATIRQSTARKAWNDTAKEKASTRRLKQKGP